MGDVGRPAGALAALVGLLLGTVHLYVHRVCRGSQVDGLQGVGGASPALDGWWDGLLLFLLVLALVL